MKLIVEESLTFSSWKHLSLRYEGKDEWIDMAIKAERRQDVQGMS